MPWKPGAVRITAPDSQLPNSQGRLRLGGSIDYAPALRSFRVVSVSQEGRREVVWINAEHVTFHKFHPDDEPGDAAFVSKTTIKVTPEMEAQVANLKEPTFTTKPPKSPKNATAE